MNTTNTAPKTRHLKHILSLFGYFVTGGSPTFVLALGGVQLLLPVLFLMDRKNLNSNKTKTNPRHPPSAWAANHTRRVWRVSDLHTLCHGIGEFLPLLPPLEEPQEVRARKALEQEPRHHCRDGRGPLTGAGGGRDGVDIGVVVGR